MPAGAGPSSEAENRSPQTKARLPGPTVLRRGPAAVKPEKSVRPPAARDKTDAAHPLRGGKQRKIKFAKRPSRSKGTDAWRARQIDEHQDAMLRRALSLLKGVIV